MGYDPEEAAYEAQRSRDDNLARIADALERIASALEAGRGQP
jgi:hypothetical protein